MLLSDFKPLLFVFCLFDLYFCGAVVLCIRLEQKKRKKKQKEQQD
jgi:hypothetical protein